MARIKTPRLVITFPTTTTAMAMEFACGSDKGRLIPVPREISGGCGLAWCAPPELEEALLDLMATNSILYLEKRVIELY